MKKNYVSPEMEIVRLTLVDAIMYSHTEGSIATEGGPAVLPGDEDPTLPGDGDL